MKNFHWFRSGLIALTITVGAGISPSAYADGGTIHLSVLKGGWFVGASGGSGTLTFHRRQYPLSFGGLSAGLVFGGSATDLVGTVSNIRRASDVAGVYGAYGAGIAVGVGGRFIVLRNDKGAILQLQGPEIGLLGNLDLSGITIWLR